MKYDDGRDLIIILLELISTIFKSEKKISGIIKKNNKNTKPE